MRWINVIPASSCFPIEGECPSRMADRGLFVGGNHETTTYYSFNGGTDSYCTSIAHKFGSGLAFARPRMARGGGRGSGSRWRARCAVVQRRLRLRLPVLWLWYRLQFLWLWYRLQLPVLRLWLRDRLQLPVLRLWLRDQLQLPVLRLWLRDRHCPPRSLCRRLASLALKPTKSRRRCCSDFHVSGRVAHDETRSTNQGAVHKMGF